MKTDFHKELKNNNVDAVHNGFCIIFNGKQNDGYFNGNTKFAASTYELNNIPHIVAYLVYCVSLCSLRVSIKKCHVFSPSLTHSLINRI